MKNNLQAEIVSDLKRRKKVFRAYMRSLSLAEKIEQLIILQERYYRLLEAREANGGREIPERWRKWHRARHLKRV